MKAMPAKSAPSTFHHHYVDTGDVRLHLAEVPGTRPLVMLHGIGMDWRVWQAVSRRLAPAFHLYLVDLRGHGESDKPLRGYAVADYAADVEDLVDRLRLRNAVLLGSSLGGVVAGATELPTDMVSHKVLVDPPLTGGPVRNAETLQAIAQLKHKDPGELTDYLRRSNPEVGQFLAAAMAEMWMASADGVIEAPLRDRACYFAIDPALEATEQPVLLMQADGNRGGVLSDTDADRAMGLLPRGSLVYVADSAHAIHATHPRQFVDLVTQFAAS